MPVRKKRSKKAPARKKIFSKELAQLFHLTPAGDAGFIVLVGVAIIAFLLAGGIATFTQENYGIQGNPVPVPSYTTHTSNQMHTLGFLTITPSPMLTPVPTTGAIQDCGITNIATTEPEVLYAYALDQNGAGPAGLKLKLFADDESTIPLGNAPAMTKQPTDSITSPNVGTTTVDAYKFPFFPAVFVTDITSPNQNSTSGDAQNGGRAYPPDQVFGSWKPYRGQDTQKNNTNLGTGADPWPPQSNNASAANGHRGFDTSYTSEIIWNMSNLSLNSQPLASQHGHQFRVQFGVHDGDQNGTDLGYGCVTVAIP